MRDVVAVAALCAAIAGCGVGGDTTLAPAGSQILAGRDISNLLWRRGSLFYTRTALVLPDPGGAQTRDLWRWDGAGDPVLVAPNLDDSDSPYLRVVSYGDFLYWYSLGLDPSPTLYHAPSDTLFTTGMLRVFNRSGTALAFQNSTRLGLSVVGSGARIDFVDLVSGAFDFAGDDLIALGRPFESADESVGLYRVSVPSGQVTALGDTLGARAALILQSCARYGGAPCGLFKVVGCGAPTAACPADASGNAPCSVVFNKMASDADLVGAPFAFDLNSGHEIPLPGLGPAFGYSRSPDGSRVAWEDVGADGTAGNVRYWDACTGASGTCAATAADFIIWSGDGTRFSALGSNGPLTLVDVSAQACHPIPQAVSIATLQFSPAGDRVAWVSVSQPPDDSPRALWLAGPDGEDARAIVTDDRLDGDFFSADGSRLFIRRLINDRQVLSWLDLGQASLPETAFTGAYGDAFIGAQRLLITANWTDQDGSGTLEVAHLADGMPLPLAPSVSEFAADGSVDGAVPVAYMLRKRFASSQDGLWMTTLPP